MAFDLDRVQKDIRKIRKFLKRAPKQATPEQVHSLRTDIRRLEASLNALPVDFMPNERPLIGKLAKFHRRAGKVRDVDVFTGYVADARMKDEDDCRVQLLEFLGAEHARHSKRLHSFAGKYGAPLRRRLKRTASRLATLSENQPSSRAAPGDAMLSELRLQQEVAAPVRLTRDSLHPYRLKVKEWRYMLQMENDPANRELIESLGEMKDAIGEWHDWQELLTIASEQLPHGAECKLIHSFQTTTDQKLKHALSVATEGKKHIRQALAPTKVGGQEKQ